MPWLRSTPPAVAAEAVDHLAGVARGLEVGGADPQRRLPALAQPVRQADVVGVHVGDDDAHHGQALQLVLEHLLPQRARLGPVDAAVHHRPALAALKRSRSSHRLMWSSAKGSGMRIHDAGRQADGAAGRGQLSPSG
jgi:hypothetical protein